MSPFAAGLQALLLLTVAVGDDPLSQRPDAWEFATTPERALSMAFVEYEEGVSLLVACAGDELSVQVLGLPAAAISSGRFERRLGDGRTEASWWDRSSSRESLISSAPARDARSFRRDRDFVLRAEREDAPPVSIDLALPAQSGNLDRVLTACGRTLESPMDAAPAVGRLLLATPGVQLPDAAHQRYDRFEVELDCLIADSRLSSCQSEHQRPADSALGAAAARQANGVRVRVSDAAAAEGRWVRIVVRTGRGR